MRCRNCGNEVNEKAEVCVSCGVSPYKGTAYCQECGAETNPKAEICVKCGVRLVNKKGSQAKGSGKSKAAAGILGILLGGFGIHRMYLGYVGMGILQLVLTLVTCGMASIWGFVEGILILIDKHITEDSKGNPLV